jgi:hypothetical protein
MQYRCRPGRVDVSDAGQWGGGIARRVLEKLAKSFPCLENLLHLFHAKVE